MTINGGTFNQTDDKNIGSSLIVNGWYNSTGTDDGVLTPDKNKSINELVRTRVFF